jgi:hypothetical protein
MYRKDLEMKRDEVFLSKYLKAADLNGKPVTVTKCAIRDPQEPGREGAGQDCALLCRWEKGAAPKCRELGQRRSDLRRRH